MLFASWFRIAVTTLLFGLSVFQFIEGEIGNGIFALLLSLVVLITVWMSEAIIFAFLAIRKGDFVKARKRLDWIKKPDGLIKMQRAYYWYLDGLIRSQSGELSKADSSLKKALGFGLYMNHDRAMAKLNLAGIAASRRRKREALNWLAEAKKDDDKKMLADQLKMMKAQISRM